MSVGLKEANATRPLNITGQLQNDDAPPGLKRQVPPCGRISLSLIGACIRAATGKAQTIRTQGS